MQICDLTLATGGKPMVQGRVFFGQPAYGVVRGNSSIVIDETADIEIAAQNTRISKTSDFRLRLFGGWQYHHPAVDL